MEIVLKHITIRELVKGYTDNGDDGVVGYDGKLDIRPPYQREYIYGEKDKEAVIDTVRKKFPLNVMYWADGGDGRFEIIDGQQRTLSICKYIECEFFYKKKRFDNLTQDEQNKILDYRLTIYICIGDDREKLDWFETINIVGKPLTPQELKNAIYHGPWVSDAKKRFSKKNGVAYLLGKNYLDGTPIRQDYLQTAIKWIIDSIDDCDSIEVYMGNNMKADDAKELWDYFENVIKWVKKVFPKYRKVMQGVDWGILYNKHKGGQFDSSKIEKQVSHLMEQEDVENKKGIYSYVFSNDRKDLKLRAFTKNQKIEAYEKQKGVCSACKEEVKFENSEADHIEPWSKDGQTISENCQILCKPCNRKKSSN